MTNVVHLPRPVAARPVAPSLAFYVRIGRNDHLEVLELIGTGETGIFGFVIDAHRVERHRGLIAEAQKRGFDIVLDPKTQPMGLPGGHTTKLAELPWGLKRHHALADFDGEQGRTRARQVVDFAIRANATQLLGPTHLLTGPNDPWLRRDINMMLMTDEFMRAAGAQFELIYSLAVPIDVLRREPERRALVAAIADAPCSAIWLKVENFGDDASGEKTAAYIEACRDFHDRGLAVVGDQIGGLPGLAALAFGALSGISHGVTTHQNFKAASWRRPAVPPGGGGLTWRVYLQQLDMLVKPRVAEAFLKSSQRVRSQHVCRDTHCCPQGIRDMLARPARHALYQQAREIEWLSGIPPSMRVSQYLDERVRRTSDNVAAVAALPDLDAKFKKTVATKQRHMSRFRQAMTHLAQALSSDATTAAPARRTRRGD